LSSIFNKKDKNKNRKVKEELIKSISTDHFMLDILQQVQDLKLPDCWIGAGFIRNKAWDILHGHDQRAPLNDIDVVYFNPNQIDPEVELELEEILKKRNKLVDWEIKNQARTHLWHKRPPYKNTTEAISEWVETATCIGAKLDEKNLITLTAPHGFEDLEKLILRPTPSLKDIDVFKNRIDKKRWIEKWPKLKVCLNQKA
jgi:uncharacterized protein